MSTYQDIYFSSTDDEEFNSVNIVDRLVVAADVRNQNTGKPAHRRKSRGRRKRRARGHPYTPFPSKKPNNVRTIERGPVSVPVPSALMTYPLKGVYDIYCSNYGIEELCSSVFQSINNRQTIQGVTVDHLRYATSLAYFFRCVQVARRRCVYLEGIEELKNAIYYRQFPEVLCNYIECLGTFETTLGVVVGPWCCESSPADWYSQVGMWSPEVFLTRLGLKGHGPWFLNYKALQELYNISSIITAHSMRMRSINFDNFKGTVSILASCVGRTQERCEGSSLIAMTDLESRIGAAFQWRNVVDMGKWPGDTSIFCSDFHRCRSFSLRTFLNNLVHKSYVDPTL